MTQAEDGRSLPKFDRPPVIEAVIGLEFAPMIALTSIELVKMHSLWSAEYPEMSEQTPLPPGSQPEGLVAGLGLRIGGAPQLRYWMLAPGGGRLIQIQNDRLVLNWRRIEGSPSDPYPSFDELEPEFMRRLTQFLERCSELALTPQPLTVEMSYVNRIETPDARGDLSGICSALVPYRGPGRLHHTQLQFVTDVPHSRGRTIMAFSPADADTISLTVTTRLALPSDNFTETRVIEATLMRAHAASVLGFAAITRDEMHKRWGRTS